VAALKKAKLDEMDRQIISMLREDSRRPYTEIARKLGITEGAVRKRVEKLVSEGVIRKFTVEVSVEEEVKAVILVSTMPSHPSPIIADKIRHVAGVKEVYEVTGEYDIVALASGESIYDVNRCIDDIRKVEGVVKTNSMIVLRTWT